MSTSRFQTTQYSAEDFVESAGAILFHISRRQICLIHHQKRDEWLLAKGRRNAGEARAATALREVSEETGFECELLQMDMVTRAPPAEEVLKYYPDEPRMHRRVAEPFMVTCREVEGGSGLKIIWWYMAAVRGSEGDGTLVKGEGEGDLFQARLFGFDEVVAKLTYKLDQDIVKKAIEVFNANEMVSKYTASGLSTTEKTANTTI